MVHQDDGLPRGAARTGRELQWHPAYMQARYENWINGLERRLVHQPAAVLRRAVPRVVSARRGRDDRPRSAAAARRRAAADRSVDRRARRLPRRAARSAWRLRRRPRRHGHLGHIVADAADCRRLGRDPDLFARVFPMDVRPQAHDIIRTWLFSTVLRAEFEHGSLPWKNAAISGWVLDPDRKKMSKSKGNVVTPMALLEEHGSDGVRYWAASGRPGTDTAFDSGQMKVGRRLAIKLLNASKFVLARAEPQGAVTAAVDRGLLTSLARWSRSDDRPRRYDYARVLERTESFFWSFCDDYLEFVKGRRYGDQGAGWPRRPTAALLAALSTLLRLFAPFLPFVTEEVWSWWQDGSVHRAPWPTPEEVLAACGHRRGAATSRAWRRWSSPARSSARSARRSRRSSGRSRPASRAPRSCAVGAARAARAMSSGTFGRAGLIDGLESRAPTASLSGRAAAPSPHRTRGHEERALRAARAGSYREVVRRALWPRISAGGM